MCAAAVDEPPLNDQSSLFEDDDEDIIPVVRRLVPAAGQPTPRTDAARSIFDFAAAYKGLTAHGGRFGDAAGFKVQVKVSHKVEVATGVTRCVGAAYPARWTPEDEERERQRRARQKPPRPTKRARTKGKKLRELIGDDDGA